MIFTHISSKVVKQEKNKIFPKYLNFGTKLILVIFQTVEGKYLLGKSQFEVSIEQNKSGFKRILSRHCRHLS